MKNRSGKTIPTAVLQSGEEKFTWLRDIRNLSIGELVELYAYAEAIVETVREPLIVLDKNLYVKSANKAFFDTFKLKKADTYGKYIYQLNGGEWNIPELRKLIDDILPRDTYFNNFEVRHTFENLGKRIMHLNARRIILEENKTELILLAIEDITVRKKLEELKDSFLGIASHELKTPLTTIKAYTQILDKRLKKSNDKKSVYFVTQVNNQIDKIHSLVNDFLDVNMIDAGKMTFKKKMFNLNNLISKIIVDFQFATEKHEIVRDGKSKGKVKGDKERIGQVLINLLTNAIKYSPEGGKIIVKVSEDDENVTVSVRDFGIGIPKKKHGLLFDKYSRVRHSAKDMEKGFGLGLYIASQIIKGHRGKIWLESKEKKGSTFYFSLPLQG